MRRLILVPLMALVVLAPSGVQAVDDPDVVCETPPEGTTVIKASNSSTKTIPAPPPALVFIVDRQFQLDLSPAKAWMEATVTADLTWQLEVNDYDLYLRNPAGTVLARSEGSQGPAPFGVPPAESVGSTLRHCSLFTVRVQNFLAVGGPVGDEIDPLLLSVGAGYRR